MASETILLSESVGWCHNRFEFGLRPDSVMAVSEWSDQHRILSVVASAEPGLWRTERTPYLKEIMDCLSSDSDYTEVVFLKGSQIGATECGLNWIGYVVDMCPGPAMLVQPTEMLAERFSRQRLDRMFRESPRLAKKIRPKKATDSANTAIMKEYDGGILIISGANSAVSLRSMPAKYLMLDEIDGYPMDVGGEGDPVKLAQARTRTFPRRKIFKASTPTIKGESRIEKAFEFSDQRYYHVPCPFCEHYQPITWQSIRWKKNQPDTAHMVCAKCDREIEEYHKTKMMKAGRWVPTNPNAPKNVAGFHLSALYSPLGWYSWKDAAKQFLEDKDTDTKYRVFVNTVLGESWKVPGEAPEWERLYERRESYKIGVVPKGGLFLVAAVDVQKDRFELEVVAYGEDKQSWSVDYRMIVCDTSDERAYVHLDSVLGETFEVEGSSTRLPIRLMAIDSGYNTQTVYHYVRTKAGRVVALKGSDKLQSIIGRPSAMEVSYGGKKIAQGVRVWPVGTSHAKTELYGWLRLPKPTDPATPYPPGYCHFPEYPDEYFKMLTAEQVTVKLVRGYQRHQWEKMRPRNEALDIRVYARAAACIVGLDRFLPADWNGMRQSLTALPQKKVRGPAADRPNTKGGIPTKPSEFW